MRAQATDYSDLGRRSVQARRVTAVEQRLEKINQSPPPLTPAQVARLEQLVARSRAACGLPPMVEDQAALDRVARGMQGEA